MSSINPHFTFEYSQPDEYHFSHDSVFLARRAYEIYRKKNLSDFSALDLCAGCGIIGLDFLFHLKKQSEILPKHFDFLEVQEVYKPHFYENLRRLSATGTETQFLLQNYEVLLQKDFAEKYDLILSNPPYFHRNQGKLSPSDFKNRCRFFLDSDFANLLKGIENALKTGGTAYILLRDQKEHGWNAFAEARKILSPKIKLKNLEDIRGTGLLHIEKSPIFFQK